MQSFTRQQKAEIQTLESFLNDSAWMELYNYNSFTVSEIIKLYEHLNSNKKGNLHREALAKEALLLFPHRTRRPNAGKRVVVYVSLVAAFLLAATVGAFALWG